jgi:hypothetical protein
VPAAEGEPTGSARLAVPPPSAAGPPCARPRTPSRRTPLCPGGSRRSRKDVRRGRPRARGWAFGTVLRGSVATGVAQPRRSSAEGVPSREEYRGTMFVADDVALEWFAACAWPWPPAPARRRSR